MDCLLSLDELGPSLFCVIFQVEAWNCAEAVFMKGIKDEEMKEDSCKMMKEEEMDLILKKAESQEEVSNLILFSLMRSISG